MCVTGVRCFIMDENKNTIFREKNLKKAADPEQLGSYLKVTSFGAYFVVLSAALVLAAIFIWVFFGSVQTVCEGAGYCKDGVINCYFEQKQTDELSKGMKADIDGNDGTVTEVDSDLYMSGDIPYEVLYLLPDNDSRWYQTAKVRCNLPDGLYSVKITVEKNHPIFFLANGK